MLTTAHCLYVFFKELLVDDLAFLGHFEDKMEDIEEYMLDSNRNVPSSEIMKYRRKSMSLAVYYQEIATMASVIPGTEWHFTWLVLVVLSLVCTGALLAFFRWKRWM